MKKIINNKNNKYKALVEIQGGRLVRLIDFEGTSFKIPADITAIGSGAFFEKEKLRTITIPNSVTSIGGGAFSDCTGLTSVTIPNSVKNIGYGAFEYCTGLTSITIPDSVTSIGNNAFRDCTGLTSITIPATLRHIGYSAFSGTNEQLVIFFGGTKARWAKIKPKRMAFSYTPTLTIHCVDGDVVFNDVEE